ncbi:MAG: YHS domain-containing (seleno)protein [Sulfitobacter sp.]|nr:YHS domain-containing (seleno)protein [Sulfitobacter sp.]
MNRFTITLAAAAAALSFSTAAFAGEQFVDETGFAVSGYDVVAYFSLPQSAIGQTQTAPVEGNKSITAEYNGATFAFSSEANRDLFTANPAKYAPQYDGHCAYGVAKGGKAPGNPTLWRIVDDKLFLNITKNVVGFWEEDIPANLNKSTANWPSLDPQPASDATIPQWSSMAPKG